MLRFQVDLDITPYQRTPHSGVGRVVQHTYNALQQTPGLPFDLRAVSRDENTVPRRLGNGRLLYHCFEHKLSGTLGVYQVVTVHDLWTLSPNPYQSALYQRRNGPKLDRAIRRADAIVTPTETVRRQILDRFPRAESKCFAIWHGCQIAADIDDEPSDKRVIQFLESSEPFLLTVACLEVRKNISLLLQALKKIPVRLVLVGQIGFGGETILNELEKHPRQNAILHLKQGSESDLRSLFRRCSVYVQSSLDEGFGMPVIDAFAFAKPVVLSDIPTFREIAHENAIFFHKQSLDSLSIALERALSGVGSGASLQAHARRFSWKKTAAQLVSLYGNILDSRNHRGSMLSWLGARASRW